MSERAAGDAAVSLWTALGLCFAEPDCGAGHVAHRTQGEARDEVVGVDKGRDKIFGKFAEMRIPCGTGEKNVRTEGWGIGRRSELTAAQSNIPRRASRREGRWNVL